MATKRKDIIEIESRGEITESAAARLLGISPNTLSAWRRRGFIGQPIIPAFRQVHKRLTAYVAAEVERLRDMRGPIPV